MLYPSIDKLLNKLLSEYFDKNIATSAPFDSLRSLYRDEFKRDPKTITWDDMYNY